jgi:hypothetical protein
MVNKEVVGITPALHCELVPFPRDLAGDPAIVTKMDKATPKDMNWIKPNTGERERLGLTSNGGARVTASFDSMTSATSCKAPAPNCIFFKEKHLWRRLNRPPLRRSRYRVVVHALLLAVAIIRLCNRQHPQQRPASFRTVVAPK